MFPFKEKWKSNQSVWIAQSESCSSLSLSCVLASGVCGSGKKNSARVLFSLNGLKLFEWVKWQDKTRANDKLSLYDG